MSRPHTAPVFEQQAKDILEDVGWEKACQVLDAYFDNDSYFASEEERDRVTLVKLRAIRNRFYMPIESFAKQLKSIS